ncbi:dynamin family protein [Micromonospora sp. WMMD730]|uniref:dynamin family protein n=1 Tax=Micromonospora sp. WMMD730 TaxID=3404128 RepID=UPI003B922432
MPAELRDRLRRLCRDVSPGLPRPQARVVDAVARRLAEPVLRIGVAGRLKAGKSTLVNALLGQRLAATAATECTLVVTRFQAGPQNRIEVRLRDGTRHTALGRPGGGVPDDVGDLGAATADIAEIVVEAANEHLAGTHVLVDTPGLDSLTGLDPLSKAAIAEVDALLFVMPHPGAGDAEALRELRNTATAAFTASNILGVLSRVDELGSGVDPWPDARRLAAAYRRRLDGLVHDVLPVHGLLAETALCDGFTEEDARMVGQLRRVAPEVAAAALYSGATFLGDARLALDGQARARLLSMLGVHGLRQLTALPGPPDRGAVAMLEHLRDASGIDALIDLIGRRFVDRADALRSVAAAATLRRLCPLPVHHQAPQALARLRDGLRTLDRHPVLRQARLTDAMADLAVGRLRLPDTERTALLTLATGNGAGEALGVPGAGPAGLRAAADAEIRRWRSCERTPDRTVRRHARLAREYCEALYFADALT